MMKRLRMLQVFVVFLFLLTGATISQGATILVPGDQPNIQAGINAASAGDTVLVADGTYSGDGNKNLDFGGKAITVRSENGPEKSIIDSQGSGTGFLFQSGEDDTSVVSGFTIKNGSAFLTGAGIHCSNSSSPTIERCIITGNEADNCDSEGTCTTSYGGGIFVATGSSPTLINSIVAQNRANIGAGIYCESDGVINIINSTIADNLYEFGNGGVICGSSASTITNSIIWNNGGSPNEVMAGSSVTFSDIMSGYGGEGNINADPLFIGGGDYRLRAGSPAIDTATADGAPDVDILGITRPQGVGYDMGAYSGPLSADFSAVATTSRLPVIYQFTDLSTGSVISWQWDFNGDGVIDSSEQNPTWTYDTLGSYTVTLTVSDGTDDITTHKTIRVQDLVFEENFESGAGGWEIDNGVWEIGTPTSGPGGCYSGEECAGTVLAGNYPNYTDSRLISPTITLPEANGAEEVHLRFWQWFSIYPYNVSYSQDRSYVQISTYDAANGWSDWQYVGNHLQDYSGGWSLMAVDLTAYAGQQVRIAFFHTSDEGDVSSGWYIDDVQIVHKVPEFDGSFEGGWGDWYADRGVWQVGEGTGPNGTTKYAGTVFDGNYPNYTDSRLVSPTLVLPEASGAEEVYLRFWQKFSIYAYGVNYSEDRSYVQISTYDASTGWSAWQSVGNIIQDYSGGWSMMGVDLKAYAGQQVRIAFYHTSDEGDVSTGWYIDDVQIVNKVPEFDGSFESGWGDWYADRGVWQVGEGIGPNGTTKYAGTVFDDDYPNYTDSRLVSPTLILPEANGAEEVHLRFWQKFSIYAYDLNYSQDRSYIQISTYDETTGWSAWQYVGNNLQDYSGGWSMMGVDLTAYAGQQVRIAFYHTSDEGDVSSGWYIDDIQIVSKVPEFDGSFETGWGDWYADRGVWQVGMPTSGPEGCAEGTQCAGTILDGNYPNYTDSRLVSPTLILPALSGSAEIHLFFRQWYSLYPYNVNYSQDWGRIEISTFDQESGWSVWTPVDDEELIQGSNGGWAEKTVDLTNYAGQQIRIAFYFSSDEGDRSAGWFVDDFSISYEDTTPDLAPLDDQSMNEGGTLSLPLSATDLDGDDITLSASGLSDFGVLVDNGDGTGVIEFNPDYGDAGSYLITVTASDGTLADSESFTLTVYNINQAPVLVDIGDQTVDEGGSLSVTISASSSDQLPLSFTSTVLPSFAQLTDNTDGTAILSLTPDYSDAGTYPLTITVSDGDQSDTEPINIIVNNINRNPVLGAIGDQTVIAGVGSVINLSATDADGDNVSFSAAGLPSFAVLTDNQNGTASLNLTPAIDDAGGYQIAVTVTDSGEPALSDSQTFSLQVNVVSLDISPNSLDFGEVTVGTTAYLSFSIANTGTSSLQIFDVQSNDGLFEVFPPTAFTIEPGAPARTVSIGFTPLAEGDFASSISILSNAGNPAILNVSGKGMPELGPGDIQTRDSLEFGSVVEEIPIEQYLTITNTGTGPLKISDASVDNSVFAVMPIPGDSLPYVIAPETSWNLLVRFTPPSGSAGTSFSGLLTITSDDPDEGTRRVTLSGMAIAPDLSLVKSPVLGARVFIEPDLFDLINSGSCANVSGQVEFGPDADSADTFQIILRDQTDTTAVSPQFQAIDGAGTAAFSGIDGCGLTDGVIEVEVAYLRGSAAMQPAIGTSAVKYTGTLDPPVVNSVPPISFSSTIEVCGTSRASTTVRVEGGATAVSTILDGSSTNFCLNVPLRPNTENTLLVSAIDDLAPAPRPIAYAQPVQVVQLDLSSIVIVNAYSRPLTQEEIETLVNEGIIDLSDPSNFNVSMFTIVFTIGSYPVPITISQPVVLNPTPGAVSYGIGGGWFVSDDGGDGIVSGIITNATQIVVITDEQGQTIPGVIIIDGRIKTLKEFFQVTLALWNISPSFILSDMTADIDLPAGLTPIATGTGTEIPDVSLDGSVDSVDIGDIAPGETGIGQFIIRGDAIGTYDITVNFEGAVTGGGLPEPIPVSGSAGTTVQVLGPPELDVVVRFATNPDGPDVTFGDVFDLLVEITNVSDRPALYTSLELFVGGSAQLVGIDGTPVPESDAITSFGHILPGETVTAAFRVKSLAEGEIIACQAIAAENITLSIDIGPDGVPCNIVNMYPANFVPLPEDAAPVVIGVNPANGQTGIPITTSVFAVLTPRARCLTADTWTNVVMDYIDPLDPSKGLQVISAVLAESGTFYLEELNASGEPVRHIPVDLTVVDPPAGGTTIAVLRLGLDSPYANSQFFLTPDTTYRATLIGGAGGVCSAASGATMENDYTWIFTTGDGVVSPSGGCLLPDSSCTTGTIEDCLVQGGSYTGDGSVCPVVGACDLPDGSCSTATEDACLGLGGTYQGDDSICPVLGACELPDGSCSTATEDACLGLGGTYQGDDSVCPALGACELPDGSCSTATQEDCLGLGGTYQGDDSVCPALGACDLPDGSCSIATQDACLGLGGTYQGDDSVCPALGACQLPDGSCVIGTQEDCLVQGGNFLGDSSECPILTGACRLPDGSCVIGTQEDCLGLGGIFQGIGTTECQSLPVGACQLPDGSCVVSTEPDCLEAGDAGGEYQGDGTTCNYTGACLLPGGCCMDASEEECAAAAGIYQGDLTLCSQWSTEVPKVTGLYEPEAIVALADQCLAAVTECVVTGSAPVGEVVSQDPLAGTLAGMSDEVLLGVSAGIFPVSLAVEGSSAGTFVNPQGPAGMITDGVGTSTFTWGVPFNSTSVSSKLEFAASSFAAITEEEFSLGTLTFTNGTIVGSSDADTVDLKIDVTFSSPDTISQSFVYNLQLIDTPNISGTSQEAQADMVKLSSYNARAVIVLDGIAYTLKVTFGNLISDTGGFTERDGFFVYEGQSATAELRGKITACSDLPLIGACMLSDGSCVQATEQDCLNVSDGAGVYLGDDTQCPAKGACILPDGCCTEGTQESCQDVGGVYQGDNTSCQEHLIEIPDVTGMSASDAQITLEALCLKVETECAIMEVSPPAGEVASQDPTVGNLVSEGTLVVLGVSTGESLLPVTVAGSSSGIFVNPTGPSTMVTTGVGTNDFSWGDPGPFDTGPSRLVFEQKAFTATSETEFSLGTLTFYNGTLKLLTDADAIDLKVDIALSSNGGISQTFLYNLGLIDTPGTRETPPEVQADIVTLPKISPQTIFSIDGIPYTLKLSFGNVADSTVGFIKEKNMFFVYEGESASAELLGKITACVDPLPRIEDLYARAKDSKINLVWTPVVGAASYKVFRGTTPGGPYELIADGYVTDYAAYADFGLTNGVTYYYVVRWVDAHGQESPDSNEAKATPTTRLR